ncbi:MAG: 2-oxoglutarate dehydrogenase E1 component, partial [Methylococcaceae bacterium]|nr:2-oxoglutarate dehydrogenase E1 component [Methylococcaceae bacterium]
MSQVSESLLSTENAPYLAELYDCFLADPHSVDASWAAFFAGLPGQEGPIRSDALDPDCTAPLQMSVLRTGARQILGDPDIRRATLDSIRALMIIRVFRVRGHLLAKVDPLGLEGKKYHPELDPKTWGFTEADMDRPIFINQVLGLETATLREILQILEKTYCGPIGVEFMHIQNPEEKAWIQQRIESIGNETHFTERGKLTILERLTQAEGFERFLHLKYPGTKRFGLDGGESTIPAIEQILKRGAQLGIRAVDLGMSHRGRLNVLASIMLKPYRAIMAEFQDCVSHPEDVEGSGDVKYHLGTSADRIFDGHPIHLSLTANPSHLEAVNPVVLGKTRARQTQTGDVTKDQAMAILLHGDAAFAGQGLVAECLGLSELQGYRTGGTIHFIINNQIGFTTSPVYSRSSPYPSDVAKTVQAPIFHVNGDNPEAVVHIARIATEFRCKFKRDVVIDMFCYRRYGHNEADEPAFTQPKMYRSIARQPTTRSLYAGKLIDEGVLTQGDADQLLLEFNSHLEGEFEAARHYQVRQAGWLQGRWEGLKTLIGEEELREEDTAVGLEGLSQVGRAMARPPPDFNLHPRLLRLFEAKQTMLETGTRVDWATAEGLAFGTLLVEGIPVRLSGQDSGRGTFSHRHAVLIDQEDEHKYIPLNHIANGQAAFEVIDSPLSEAS